MGDIVHFFNYAVSNYTGEISLYENCDKTDSLSKTKKNQESLSKCYTSQQDTVGKPPPWKKSAPSKMIPVTTLDDVIFGNNFLNSHNGPFQFRASQIHLLK